MTRRRQNNSIAQIARLISIFFPLICSSCGLYLNSLDEKITPEERSSTKKMCTDLVVPVSFKKVGEFEVAKDGLEVYTINFESDENPDAVQTFFVNSLSQPGWAHFPRHTGGTTYLQFDKAKYSIVIEYDRFSLTATRLYGISCSLGVQ